MKIMKHGLILVLEELKILQNHCISMEILKNNLVNQGIQNLGREILDLDTVSNKKGAKTSTF